MRSWTICVQPRVAVHRPERPRPPAAPLRDVPIGDTPERAPNNPFQVPIHSAHIGTYGPPDGGLLLRAGDAYTEMVGRVEHAVVVADEGIEVGAELERAREVDGVERAEMGG